MGGATVSFRKCVFNPPTNERGNDCVATRIFFDLYINGENYEDVYVEVCEIP